MTLRYLKVLIYIRVLPNGNFSQTHQCSVTENWFVRKVSTTAHNYALFNKAISQFVTLCTAFRLHFRVLFVTKWNHKGQM